MFKIKNVLISHILTIKLKTIIVTRFKTLLNYFLLTEECSPFHPRIKNVFDAVLTVLKHICDCLNLKSSNPAQGLNLQLEQN